MSCLSSHNPQCRSLHTSHNTHLFLRCLGTYDAVGVNVFPNPSSLSEGAAMPDYMRACVSLNIPTE